MHRSAFARTGLAALLVLLFVPALAVHDLPDPRAAFERRDMEPVRAWLEQADRGGERAGSINALRARAWLLRRDGRNESALELLEQAIERAPGRADLRVDRAEFRNDLLAKAGPFGKLKIARQIRDDLERAVEHHPGNVDALVALATFHLRAPGIIGGKRERGRALLDALEQSAPARADALRALIAAEDEALELAVEHIVEAIEVDADPPPKWLLRLGRWQRDLGCAPCAQRAFARALELAPEFAPAAIERARLALKNSDALPPDDAIDALRRIAGQPPFPGDASNAERWRLLSRLYRAQGRSGPADQALVRAEAAAAGGGGSPAATEAGS